MPSLDYLLQTFGQPCAIVEARAILDAHVRQFDGRCSCGTFKECPAYEAASATLAGAHALPCRRPGAALPPFLKGRRVALRPVKNYSLN